MISALASNWNRKMPKMMFICYIFMSPLLLNVKHIYAEICNFIDGGECLHSLFISHLLNLVKYFLQTPMNKIMISLEQG